MYVPVQLLNSFKVYCTYLVVVAHSNMIKSLVEADHENRFFKKSMRSVTHGVVMYSCLKGQ